MKKKLILGLSLSLAITGMLSVIGGISYAAYSRTEKIVDTDGDEPPITIDNARNTAVYFVPTAWSSLLTAKENCYVVACMYKNDDSMFEFQFIRTCDEEKVSTGLTETINVGTQEAPQQVQAYKFLFDQTYYDRISFHRIAHTDNLASYMGEDILDTWTTKSTQENHLPLDWRNIDKNDAYRRYDATHRQVKPSTSNVFQVTSTNSGGSFGYLAWGEWYSNVII